MKDFYSLYSSGWNLIDNLFDYKFHIDNFCEFIKDSGEVVICINKSSDSSLEEVEKLTSKYNNLRIIESDISYNRPGMDGEVKNFSLQNTKNPVKLHLDLDESINISLKPQFDEISQNLLNSNYQAIMVPVINLYKDKYHYKDINFKWRIHKSGLSRGVVNFARNSDGTHDIEKSDGCELIQADGNLANSFYLVAPGNSDEEKLFIIKNYNLPFVWHYGLINLEIKAARNRNFWKNHWATESGRQVEIELSAEEFENKFDSSAKTHGLNLE